MKKRRSFTARIEELSGVLLMGMLVDCASGASPGRLARIRVERRTALLGDMMDSWYPEICTTFPEAKLEAAYREPFVSHVPTLFLAGTLDANTPPWQSYEVSWGWPNATILVVDGAGHESLMPWRPAQDIVVDFFRGEDVSGRRLARPAIEFLPVEEQRTALRTLATLRRGTFRLLVLMALQDGGVREERAAVAQTYLDLLGQAVNDDRFDAEVVAVSRDTRRAGDFARELAPHANDAQKAVVLRGWRGVADADGDFSSGERELLTEIGIGWECRPTRSGR